jgi:hypothetical protein
MAESIVSNSMLTREQLNRLVQLSRQSEALKVILRDLRGDAGVIQTRVDETAFKFLCEADRELGVLVEHERLDVSLTDVQKKIHSAAVLLQRQEAKTAIFSPFLCLLELIDRNVSIFVNSLAVRRPAPSLRRLTHRIPSARVIRFRVVGIPSHHRPAGRKAGR